MLKRTLASLALSFAAAGAALAGPYDPAPTPKLAPDEAAATASASAVRVRFMIGRLLFAVMRFGRPARTIPAPFYPATRPAWRGY